METLLSLVYPMPYEIDPDHTLAYLCDVLRASEKYDMKSAISQLVKAILVRLESEPKKALEVYAIGPVSGIKEVVSGASKTGLRCSPKELFEVDETVSSETGEVETDNSMKNGLGCDI